MKRRRLWSRSLARIAPMPLLGGAFSSLLLLLVSLGLFIFSSAQPAAFGGLRAGTADAFAPVLGAVSRPFQDAAAFVRNVTGIAELQAENIALRQENIRLRDWYQTALLLEAENKSLKDLLNVTVESSQSYITTRVMGDGGNAFVKSLLLSAGTQDGVRKNQSVLSGEGLIGRIIEAGGKSSRVLLLTDINSRVPVMVENSRQHAILAGTNGEKLQLVHTQGESVIEAGARIITSGHGGLFPQGLPVGRVMTDENGKFYVKLFADMDRLVHVRVVDKPEDPNLHSLRTDQF